MLRSLDIRDVLLIDRLELNFETGLNVLTGETGAGKSILLDSLGFVLGWRGRAELVRSGADQGEVIAEFQIHPDHAAHAVLAEAGLPAADELILRRINTVEGRKTAWVNDRRVSGQVLRDLSETLVELHGQHDDRGLLNPRGHRQLLDTFAELGLRLADLRGLWTARSRAAKALTTAQAELAEMRREEDFLRHAVAELDKLNPEAGEDASLDTQRRRMQGAEKIRDDLARAYAILGGDGAEGALTDGLRWLDGIAAEADGQLDALIAALGRALTELGEATYGVERVLEQLDFNPHDLEAIEERLFAIRGLARKHAVQPDDLGPHADVLRKRLASLDAGQGDIARLQSDLAAAETAYDAAAQDITARRQAAAKRLDTAVMAELAPLKMERAVFETLITGAEPGPDGQDAVSFTVATNPGAPAGPLAKIASGGELSRFLLALKVCLSQKTEGVTMIFDEIDRGVGGATADAVGRRLARLAKGGQVLVVTHSPQVAALGRHHWRVQKSVCDGQTLSQVIPLDPTARVDEVARMISGDTISDAARAAARALLD